MNIENKSWVAEQCSNSWMCDRAWNELSSLFGNRWFIFDIQNSFTLHYIDFIILFWANKTFHKVTCISLSGPANKTFHKVTCISLSGTANKTFHKVTCIPLSGTANKTFHKELVFHCLALLIRRFIK